MVLLRFIQNIGPHHLTDSTCFPTRRFSKNPISLMEALDRSGVSHLKPDQARACGIIKRHFDHTLDGGQFAFLTDDPLWRRGGLVSLSSELYYLSMGPRVRIESDPLKVPYFHHPLVCGDLERGLSRPTSPPSNLTRRVVPGLPNLPSCLLAGMGPIDVPQPPAEKSVVTLPLSR